MGTTVYKGQTFAEVVKIIEKCFEEDLYFGTMIRGKFTCIEVERFALRGESGDATSYKIPNTEIFGIGSLPKVCEMYETYTITETDGRFEYTFIPIEGELYELEVEVEEGVVEDEE